MLELRCDPIEVEGGKFRALKLVTAELSGKTVLGCRGGAGAGPGTSVACAGACSHLRVCRHLLRCGQWLSQQCRALALGWTAWAEHSVLVNPLPQGPHLGCSDLTVASLPPGMRSGRKNLWDALIHGPDIPGSYAILLFTALDLASIISHIHSWVLSYLSSDKAMATHSSVLAWRIPGTGEPGGLPSMGRTESDILSTSGGLGQEKLTHSLQI